MSATCSDHGGAEATKEQKVVVNLKNNQKNTKTCLKQSTGKQVIVSCLLMIDSSSSDSVI